MKYKLHNVDCLEFMRSMPDKSVDAVITDLPYGTTACAWDEIIPFIPMWEQVNRVSKDLFITTCSQPFTSRLVMSNLENFKYEWIWNKNKGLGFQHAKNMPIKRHENIVVFSSKSMGHFSLLKENRMTYNPIGARQTKRKNKVEATKHGELLGARPNQVGVEYFESENYPNSVLKYSSETDGDHPTQKPVALFEYLIRTYTNEGDTVLDFCMGSGTTGVAAMQTKRNFIGCDSDKEHGYFQIAERRIKQAAAQEVMFT